jgi:hypothetical protein
MYCTFFGKKSLIDVIVAGAFPLFPKSILYAISSQTFTVFSFVQSVNVFLIRRSGSHFVGIGSWSHFSFNPSAHAHATFSYQSLSGIISTFVITDRTIEFQDSNIHVVSHSKCLPQDVIVG